MSQLTYTHTYHNSSWTLHCSNWLEWLSTRTKLPRFNYFTINSTPLCVSTWDLLCQTYCCIAPDSGCMLYVTRHRMLIAPTATWWSVLTVWK